MIKVYESVEDLLKDMMPMLCLPFIILTLRCIFNIVNEIIRGTVIVMGEGEKKTKEYNEKIEKLEKAEITINIDKDLQKYFNYKE